MYGDRGVIVPGAELYLISVRYDEHRRDHPRIDAALAGIEGAQIVGRGDIETVKVRISPESLQEVQRRIEGFCDLQKHAEMELLA